VATSGKKNYLEKSKATKTSRGKGKKTIEVHFPRRKNTKERGGQTTQGGGVGTSGEEKSNRKTMYRRKANGIANE